MRAATRLRTRATSFSPTIRGGGYRAHSLECCVLKSLSKSGKTEGRQPTIKTLMGLYPRSFGKLRTFFRDSALFRTIIRRSDNGGFIEDPEYPLFVLDEAVVNAAIHRDYGATTPIHYIAYKDGLVVKNPGSIPQDVPRAFQSCRHPTPLCLAQFENCCMDAPDEG